MFLGPWSGEHPLLEKKRDTGLSRRQGMDDRQYLRSFSQNRHYSSEFAKHFACRTSSYCPFSHVAYIIGQGPLFPFYG